MKGQPITDGNELSAWVSNSIASHFSTQGHWMQNCSRDAPFQYVGKLLLHFCGTWLLLFCNYV